MQQHKSEREKLVDEIAQLSQASQAEKNFTTLFEGHENPWAGAGEQLSTAETTLAALDAQLHLDAFGKLINYYRQVCASQRSAMKNTDRLREIEAEKREWGDGYVAIVRGAEHRHGPPTSARDARDREAAKRYRQLEEERCMLALQIQNCRENRARVEAENPFLVALGAQIDAEANEEMASVS